MQLNIMSTKLRISEAIEVCDVEDNRLVTVMHNVPFTWFFGLLTSSPISSFHLVPIVSDLVLASLDMHLAPAWVISFLV